MDQHWYGSMDEPGTPRLREIQGVGKAADEGIGLLRIRDGSLPSA